MKMAKSSVVAKGWDRRENQSLSSEEKSDLKEEIFTSRRRERAPEKSETSQNLPQLSHSHPVEQKEPGEMRSASVGEETKIPPGSREAAESSSSKSREISVGSGFTQNSKESKPQTDPSAKDPEFSFEEKTGRKRIGNVSPGRKEEMKTDSVTHLQPAPTATEADTGSSSQSGISGSAGKIPAPETESQDSKKLKGRNASVERLLTGGDPSPEQNQSKPEEDKVPSPDVLPKSSYGKPEKAEEETKPPPSVWDQLPSAETSNFQNETGVKDTQTFPDREEMCGTSSPKQHGDPIRSWKKAKGRGRRRKTTQQSSNFQIRTGPICEAPTNQPDTKSADPSVGNPPVKTRKPRKRKHVEADDASRSPKVASPGAAADSQHFLSPSLSVLSEKCGSGKMEDLEPHNSDKPDEGVTCGKIRRSCTLEKKTSSADEEWLIRYSKGSRRKPSKGSNRKTEGNPDANAEQQMLQQTGRGRKKTVGSEGFPTFPAFALDSDRQEVSAEPSTSESCGANVSGGGRADMSQIEGSSESKVDSSQVYSKIVPKKMKKGPKRRRMLSKQTILDPKISESDEKHPEEGDPGATEVGKLPKARRGRKKKVIMIKMEDGASVQVGSSWMNPEGQTGATPEPCGSDTMNSPQIEGTSDNKVDFSQVYSKMAPPKKKRGPKRRRLSSKEPIVDPKISESDEKHPQEGDPGAPEVGKPPKARRGRKKKVFMIKMEEGASVQDGSSWMNPGRTGATPEPSESNTMNSPQIEEMSSSKDNFSDTYSKIAPTKKKRGPKRRRISSKQPILDPTISESDEKHPEEGDPGAPEVGKPPKARRGRKKKILTVKMEEEASCFTEKSQVTSSFQDECNTTGSGAETVTGAEMRGKMNSLQPEGAPADPDVSVQVSSNVWNQNPGNMMNSGGKTAATSETSESNGMNSPQIKEMSGQKDDLREVDFKVAPTKKKRGPKRRRTLSKQPISDPKILESDDAGAPEVEKPPNMRRGRKKKILTVKIEEGAPVQVGSSWMNPKGQTTATPEPCGSNTMNSPQIMGTSDIQVDFSEVYSKMAPTKMKRGPKRRRIWSKKPISDPKIHKSDEKHPQEGDPGAPEVGKPPKARRGRKKKVLTVKLEEKASCFMGKSQVTSSFQDESNRNGSGAETVTGAELQGKMNSLQPEGAPADPDVSVQVSSNVWNQNQTQTLQNEPEEHKIVEYDEDSSHEQDTGAAEDRKISLTPIVRRGRKKNVFKMKMEEGAPVQVGSSWMNPEGQTAATPESSGSNTMNSPQIEEMSGSKDGFSDVAFKMAPTKMKRGPKRRRIWSKKPISDPKISKSDEKHPEEGDPGAPEVGKPPKARRGRKKKVLTVKLEEEASCFTEKSQVTSSFQDESNTTGSGAETVTGAEIGGTMNSLQPEGAPADPDVSVQVSSKVWNQNQIQTLQNDPEEHKIVEYDEDSQHEQDTGAAEDGEISLLPTVKRGRKKNVFKMKMEEGAPVQVGSCWMNPEGQTTATPEPCESDRMSLPQIEGMSGSKDDFSEVDFKTAPTKMKRGPKRRRIWSKKTISDAKISESDEKHPQERAMGTPEVGKPPKARRGRKKKVAIITMEDGASVQDKTSWMEPGSQTEATSETSKTNMMNSPQIEGTSNSKGDFSEVDSKIVPKKMKGGPKRRWISVKQSISEPKIQESDEKHPLQGDRKAPGDGETPEVFVIKTEDKSPVQDKTNWMDPGGQTRVIQEASEFDRMNLPHIERPSDPKDDFPEVYSKIAPTKMKRGPKRRRILSKQSISGPKISESDEKHTNEGVPEAQEAQEDGRTPKVRRGRKKKVLTVQREEGAQVQVGSSWMDPKGQTGWCPEPSVSNTTNSPPIEGLSYSKDYLQVANAKVTIGKKIGPKRRRISSKQSISEPQISETDETHSEEGDPGAPVDGKPASVRRRRRKKVLTVKMEEEAPRLMENSQMMSSFQESETKKPFQESVSAAPRKTIRKRRRRSKTHWTGDKKAKKPRTCPFWDAPAFPGSCDETFNIGQGNSENRMMTNVPSGPEISCRLQERKKEKKYLQCSFCSRSFRHISASTRHRRLHTGRKPYGCSVCSRSFSRLSQSKSHSKVHSEPPAARCPCCEETFRDKKELLNHLRVHSNEVERPRREVGGSRVSRPSADQDKSFRCSVCSKEFTKKSTFEKHRRIHGRKPRSSRKTPSDSREVRGFLVSRLGDAAVVTPVFFKCPICRQVHRHWCHYVSHLQSHTSGRSHGCDECGQDYSSPAGTGRHCSVCCRASGEEKACADSSKDIWEEGGASGRNDQQTTRPDAENEERSSAFPEGRNGKTFVAPPSPGGSSSSAMEDVDLDVPSLNSSFSSVSDPTSKQAPRFHPESPRSSWRSCFGRFPHGTRRGARRHLPQRTLRCRRCESEFHFSGSYMDHLREHDVSLTPRRAPDGLKCSACGKLFSTPRNSRKHQSLHKGSRFHICSPCGRSFSRHSALKAHSEAHRRRSSVPQPAPVEEPFSFPYPCRKCSARFSSTELSEAHQVCHFVAGRKPENPPESISSFIPVIRRVDVSPSGPKRKLPVSDRKDSFRYPDPDRSYVVPDVSSEPPLVVSDEEPDDPPPGEPTEAELELQLSVQSLIPEKRPTSSSDSSSSDSESEPVPQWTNCAICTQTFVDLTASHEHYRKHAGGM